MVFSSIVFLFLFLPIVITLHFLIGNRARNLFLLCASLFFYAWGEGFFVFIMLVSITANYFSGLLIDRFRHGKPSKPILFGAIAINTGLLSTYKYANFLVDNVNAFSSFISIPPLNLGPVHLPIGISFFTFQAMSYVIDVYKNESSVQKDPINLGLYIALFPQLITGPIVRYRDIANQIIDRTIKQEDFAYGVKRFIFGLGKKVLIANQLAVVSDQIFSIPTSEFSVSIAWLGIVCYSLQIYFDFSGYSDMAIGLGRIFGFRFLENFNYPYISQSIQEFWRRWHISLSSWFRNFVYIPLGGNRRGPKRTYLNLVIVFFLCGLWHGASWNFVIWGLMHGLFLVIERLGFITWLKKLWKPIRHVYVLLVITVCWVFFRIETLEEAFAYLSAMFGSIQWDSLEYPVAMYLTPVIQLTLFVAVICSTPILTYFLQLRETIINKSEGCLSSLLEGLFASFGTIAFSLVLIASIMHLAAGAYNPFIYFRF